MGFRSVFISEDIYMEHPQWFREKWGKMFYILEHGSIASRFEMKTYSEPVEDFFKDVQQVLKENLAVHPNRSGGEFEFIAFHECGGVTKYKVTPDQIVLSEPISWQIVENVSHYYCYGCSDLEEIK